MTVFWVSTFLNTAAAGLVLLRPRRAASGRRSRPPVDARRVGCAAVVTLIALGLELPLLRHTGMNKFGAMNLAFLSLFVMLPVLGLSTLIAAVACRRPNPGPYVSKTVCALAVVAVGLAPIGAYASLIEPYSLRLETAGLGVPPGRAGREPLRIGVLTDIQTDHITGYEESAVAKLMSQQPDVILLPGDFYQGPAARFAAALPAYRNLLAGLQAPGGVFAVLGNIDGRDTLECLVQGTSVRLLLDESVRIPVRDRIVTLCGVSSYSCSTPASMKALRECESLPGEDDIRILLCHSPDGALALSPSSRIDLVVSGHTHGGQIVFPLIGPLVTFSHVPRNVGAGGLHILNGHPVYVSRGVGRESSQAPCVRFLCPPDVSVVNLGERAR